MNHKKSTPLISKGFDLNLFKEIVRRIKEGNKTIKEEEIKNILSFNGLVCHFTHKITKKMVIVESIYFEYDHELHTAKKLAGENYDVIFVPKGYFKREEKRFDVFLSRGHIFFESDLKCITSEKPDTIGKRIKDGSEQSSRIVLDIHSVIQKRDLIDGLKTGCSKNNMIKEILLFYNSHFYCLPKSQILSKRIFKVIK